MKRDTLVVKNEEFVRNAITDIVEKIPDLKSYDVLIRLGQILIQLSDATEKEKILSNVLANSIIKSLDKNMVLLNK
jgi:hypothetical protein